MASAGVHEVSRGCPIVRLSTDGVLLTARRPSSGAAKGTRWESQFEAPVMRVLD